MPLVAQPSQLGMAIDEVLRQAATAARTRELTEHSQVLVLGPPDYHRQRSLQYVSVGALFIVVNEFAGWAAWPVLQVVAASLPLTTVLATVAVVVLGATPFVIQTNDSCGPGQFDEIRPSFDGLRWENCAG